MSKIRGLGGGTLVLEGHTSLAAIAASSTLPDRGPTAVRKLPQPNTGTQHNTSEDRPYGLYAPSGCIHTKETQSGHTGRLFALFKVVGVYSHS